MAAEGFAQTHIEPPKWMEVVRSAGPGETVLQVSDDLASVDDVIYVARTGEVMRVVGGVPLVLKVVRGLGLVQPRQRWWRRLLGAQQPARRGVQILDGDELLIVGNMRAVRSP